MRTSVLLAAIVTATPWVALYATKRVLARRDARDPIRAHQETVAALRDAVGR